VSKRETKSDIPRRIYKTTIERINKHLEAKPRKVKQGSKEFVKGDFNKFLEVLLDTYEGLQDAPRKYINESFDSLEDARGDAIMRSMKSKQEIRWPKIVVEVGEDG